MQFKKYYIHILIIALSIVITMNVFEEWLNVVSQATTDISRFNKSDYSAFLNSYTVFDYPKHTKHDEIKVNAVYKLLVPLMEFGGLNKFYIPPLMDKSRSSFFDLSWNQELFERNMTDALQLGPGKIALDIGCGKGLVANMVFDHSGSNVTGINISPEQITKAKDNAEKKGLSEVLDFYLGSMNEPLPFPNNSFDAVYIIQASPYAHDFSSLMLEIRRILKPGGLFSDLAVVTLDKYNIYNKTHVRMANEAKRVGVIPVWRSRQYYLDGCITNGFTVKFSKNLGHSGMMKVATEFFNPLGNFIKFLKYMGIVNKELVQSINRMNEHAMSLIQGDELGLFTTNYWIVCESPM